MAMLKVSTEMSRGGYSSLALQLTQHFIEQFFCPPEMYKQVWERGNWFPSLGA